MNLYQTEFRLRANAPEAPEGQKLPERINLYAVGDYEATAKEIMRLQRSLTGMEPYYTEGKTVDLSNGCPDMQKFRTTYHHQLVQAYGAEKDLAARYGLEPKAEIRNYFSDCLGERVFTQRELRETAANYMKRENDFIRRSETHMRDIAERVNGEAKSPYSESGEREESFESAIGAIETYRGLTGENDTRFADALEELHPFGKEDYDFDMTSKQIEDAVSERNAIGPAPAYGERELIRNREPDIVRDLHLLEAYNRDELDGDYEEQNMMLMRIGASDDFDRKIFGDDRIDMLKSCCVSGELTAEECIGFLHEFMDDPDISPRDAINEKLTEKAEKEAEAEAIEAGYRREEEQWEDYER